MDINDGLYDSVKYIFGTILSAVLSLSAWKFKKHTDRIDTIEHNADILETNYKVFEVEIRTIREDISEIKSDLKELLFKKSGVN